MRRVLPVLLLLAAGLALWWGSRAPSNPPRAVARTLVLVTIDTWRRDHAGVYGARPSPTPRIDAWAAGAAVFRDARSPVPLTLPAHATMLTGLPPAATGVRLNSAGRVPEAGRRPFALLPERLAAAGWRTGAFVSATPLAARYGLDQGFERYDDEGLEDLSALSFAERPGAETVDRGLAWLASLAAGDRAFLWIHLFEPHAPYAPGLPQEQGYAADVATADAAFGRLLDGLARAGRGDAAVLLTADHGEALGDLGEPTHGLLLGDAVLRVPLILAAPGVAPGWREGPADLADVGPTLASLAGVPGGDPPRAFPGTGVDLLAGPLPAERPRVAESFYAHHRYRWAQLTAAVGSDGSLLVEVGSGRALTLRTASPGEPQRTPEPVTSPASTGRLAQVIADYKQAERPELITEGAAPGGYAQAGRAQPFLPGEENARLANPYDRIAAAVLLDRQVFALRSGAIPPPRAAEALRGMAAADPGNPEIWFWLGEARQKGGDLAGAEEAYLEAWKAGRRDPSTLYVAVGVHAAGREEAMLERLDLLGREVRWDAALHVLRARLLHERKRPEEACAELERAAAACRSSAERATVDRVRRELGCD